MYRRHGGRGWRGQLGPTVQRLDHGRSGGITTTTTVQVVTTTTATTHPTIIRTGSRTSRVSCRRNNITHITTRRVEFGRERFHNAGHGGGRNETQARVTHSTIRRSTAHVVPPFTHDARGREIILDRGIVVVGGHVEVHVFSVARVTFKE